MDTLEGTRAQMMAVIDNAMENGVRVAKDLASGQSGLFAELAASQPAAAHPLPKVPDWAPKEKLTSEKEMLGFYITGHPLDEYREKVEALSSHTTAGLEGLPKSTEVALCGVLTGVQRRRTKEGKPWALMQIEDLVGSLEALVFTTQFERLSPLLNEDQAMLVRGLVLPEENAPPKISIQDIVPLEVARLHLPSLISIKVPLHKNGVDRPVELQNLFRAKPGDTGVRFRLEKPRDFSLILDVSLKVRADKEFCAEVTRICGVDSVEVLGN
jgi:DNA polymerase-3 subunit alpha